ncbi:MAG: hypothetical protein ACKOYO_08320, partial [Actinomycetota bacterium]
VEYLDRLEGSDMPVGHLVGAITVMAQSMLSAGARPDRLQPPRRDTGTTRQVWGSYPVRFDRWEAAGTSA